MEAKLSFFNIRTINDLFIYFKKKFKNSHLWFIRSLGGRSQNLDKLHSMRIVHIASEISPLAKVGGLGDMIGGLAKELVKKESQVEVIIPGYDFVKLDNPTSFNFQAYEDFKWYNAKALNVYFEKFQLTLIEPGKEITYFNRPNIYGYNDDPCRFIFFSRAVMEYLFKKNEEIDILHIHDWHTSLCALLYRDMYKDLGLKIKKIILNIHNIEYQGLCSPADLDKVGLKGEKYLSPSQLQDPLSSKNLNLLKGGIIYSDAIVAVSPTYAKEILTKELGFGLEEVLNNNKDKLRGILNGIDIDIWNPENDPLIKYHYSCKMPVEEIVQAKQKNKEDLRKLLGLSQIPTPLICNIGRLVKQKGPELIEHCLNFTLKNKGQFLLLGSTTIPKIQKHFTMLAKKYEQSEEISINLAYDDALAHQIYAACDFIIIPSLFEPCGLTQMIALRYGTIPIVRKTGGLSDTVFDVDDPSFSKTSVNGFTFEHYGKKEFNKALKRAFAYWSNDKNTINKLIENGLNTDHSLEKVTKEYLQLYRS
jgi:starch synthase